jgi:dTDP-glucose 4,6-dehydratase
LILNYDAYGHASDLTSMEALPQAAERHTLLQVDLSDAEATAEAVRQADPDLVLHLATESHVDRSIEGPGAYGSPSSPDYVNIASNVSGTDEVFGSLGATGHFSETTPYDPRRPAMNRAPRIWPPPDGAACATTCQRLRPGLRAYDDQSVALCS